MVEDDRAIAGEARRRYRARTGTQTMRNRFIGVIMMSTAATAAAQPVPDDLACWPVEERPAYAEFEAALNAIPSAGQLRHWHDLLASFPHVAGTPGDARTVDVLAEAFASFGLEVERQELWVYLPRPVAAELEILAPERVVLPLRERPVADDPHSGDERVGFGWNGFSGSGEAVGTVVYANYGRKEDFERLAELGISCEGRIVMARYGGNYRGYKAAYAEQAGAVGLLIYSDPADVGYTRGLMWPEGGHANETYIQRGSVRTTPYAGDPLTPFVPATQEAPRLDEASVPGLPTIPVQPISWLAAEEILRRMDGAAVPEGWQGGLPMPYRLQSSDALRVRLRVEQSRQITRTWNVLGVLRGEREPERLVVIGCHHDAWGFGASDATCGMIALLESARSFGTMAQRGWRPARTLVFAGWGAEEMGIIGSTEWVEAWREALVASAVAYLNLDMASMGVEFGASASPSLHALLLSAARAVPQARDPSRSVFQAWVGRSASDDADGPPIGELGGGSDHVAFVCHAGVASAGLGAGGAPGTAYHSAYDTLTWYRRVVGDDYEPALMIARMTNTIASRLANAPLLPLDPTRTGPILRRHLRALTRRGLETGVFEAIVPGRDVALALGRIDLATLELDRQAQRLWQAAQARVAYRNAGSTDAELAQVNASLLAIDRLWLDEEGLPGRPWYRNLFIAPDETSGYASWPLPALRHAIERGDRSSVQQWAERYEAVVTAISEELSAAADRLEAASASGR